MWIGPRDAPLNAMNTWRDENPGWAYRFWDEAAMATEFRGGLRNQRQFDEMAEWNGKCDIARYEILHKFGGFFVDADSVCLRPLDDYLTDNDSFSCYENEWARGGLIAAGFLATSPGNELADLLVKGLTEKTGDDLWRGPGSAWMTVGPLYLTRTVHEHRYTRIAIYPSFFFLPNHYSGLSYDGPARPYADHWWGSTQDLNAEESREQRRGFAQTET